MVGDRQLAAHGLILGASGAGKTTTLLALLTGQIADGKAAVVIDLKGSPAVANALAQAARAAGRPFRLWTPDWPGHWNPLAHGTATELKDKLIATERFTEPHYQRAAERYLQTTIQVVQANHPDRPVTLAEVVALLDPMRIAGKLAKVDRSLAMRVREYLSALTPDRSAITGIASRLAVISESHTGPYLQPDGRATIDLRQAIADCEVVLFSLNSSTYGKLAAHLAALVIQDLIAAAGDRLSRPEQPLALVAIDEFSALGADNTLGLLARARESGISVLRYPRARRSRSGRRWVPRPSPREHSRHHRPPPERPRIRRGHRPARRHRNRLAAHLPNRRQPPSSCPRTSRRPTY